jgi:hypothetical protein
MPSEVLRTHKLNNSIESVPELQSPFEYFTTVNQSPGPPPTPGDREDLSEWAEARALVSANSNSVADFLWEDVACRYDFFERLIIDGGPGACRCIYKEVRHFVAIV